MVLLIYLLLHSAHLCSALHPEEPSQTPKDPPHVPTIYIPPEPKEHVVEATVVEVKPVSPVDAAKIGNKSEPQPPLIHTPNFKKNDLFESGAMLRAFYVLLGATFLLMIYLGFRMFRLRRGSKPPSMVMKYGVLTRREDSEILPLPLSEDEDDDNTVFELNPVNR